MNKLNEIETFNNNMDSFELEFAIRFAKQYFLNPKIFDEYLKNKIDKRIKKINN